ncbi:TonB-linked SusC/RagA family outer membrane protein [Dyadobacter jejuensis]|uniref:TonB-linked SusC/RagA family outer membrane protein n=1 Tax=Dyadobacter jejuensis TaxID=1082580 RepID=A0A316AJE5_9BACT|nr:TonB-dependent receptor [Dyadobacter jejuensis]PWJ57935.1 TonB-linked SusC/RagA family outer membrane protein [Dyadobacter jejuensis]
MKLSFIQILLAAIAGTYSYGNEVNAQELLNQKVTLSVEQKEIKTVLTMLEAKSGVKFVYSPKSLPVERLVSLSLQNKTVSEVLAELFKPDRISTKLIKDRIVLKIGSDAASTEINAPQASYQWTVTGTVTDESNLPLPGVSIAIKGTAKGTTTGVDGTYSLQLPEQAAVLVFSYVGFLPSEVSVTKSGTVNVSLKVDTKSLEEVVVVGYGTQKKSTLSGAVFQVSGDEALQGRATTNAAAALQGQVPGLTITRSSSRPGNEGTSISLRGGISVNAVSPMIVIDGIASYQWELSQINPNDIESISVLKDAAASIYGTRAAGGVILVTTKRGETGKVKVKYTGSAHLNYIGKRFPVASGQEWAQMNIIANTNDAVASGSENNWWLFTGEEYQRLANNEAFWRSDGKLRLDPTANQFDAVYGNTWGQNHNVSFSGGTDKIRTFTSLGFANDRSLVDVVYDGTKKYNFRTNLDYSVNKWIKTEANLSYDKRLISTPTRGVGEGIQDMFIFPLYNPAGNFYDAFGSNNLLAKLIEGGRINNTETFFRLAGKATIDMGFIRPLAGLSLTANANIKERNGIEIERGNQVTMYDWEGELGKPDNIFFQTKPNDLYVTNTNTRNLYNSYGGFLNYNKSLSGHNLSFLAGITSEMEQGDDLYAKRSYMASNDLDAINTGDATYDDNSGNSNAWALVSYLSRLNYDFKETLLLQVQYRRDGSSKLAPENRWADFVGAEAGLRLTQFKFMQNQRLIDNLKLRASYGELGSLSGIGNYDYVSGIGTGTTIFGTTPTQTQTAWVSGLSVRDRSWERVASTNLAVDFTLLQNRLSGSFDYFIRKNKGMLVKLVYPSTLGTGSPFTNDGHFVAKGFETMLAWQDRIGKDLRYNVGVTLSDAKTEVTKYNGSVAINAGTNSVVEGKPLNSIYVYRTNGFLQSEEEVTNYYNAHSGSGSFIPVNGTTNRLTPGSAAKVDMNKDGAITTDDLDYYGDANPHYTFGINLGLSYKGFDFTSFFQGVGQQYLVRTDKMSAPFRWSWTNQNRIFLGQTWSPDHTDAPFPVLTRNGSRNDWNYTKVNDYNVQNISYMRCKSMILGYTLPSPIIKKLGLDRLRLWVSGDNLFEFHNVKDGFDPESQAASGQGKVDVYSRTVSFGIDLGF